LSYNCGKWVRGTDTQIVDSGRLTTDAISMTVAAGVSAANP